MAEKKLGPYILKDVLGRGGMGTVYRGIHEDSGEERAIKALSPNFAEDDHFRNRFESEIKALIKLDHPNIVRLDSYGQEEGNLYFAMELVKGQSLFHLQRKKHHFDWREILSIARDVGQGLRHAHDRGVIHRDLKPGNLLRADSGENKITDFGIAKSFGASQNTGTNVLGTIDFMSPEQAKGQPVTVRSDLYSLGTVLYTLLCGKPPFRSNSVEESIRNLTKVPPPPVTSIVPSVPKQIEQLLQRLMHKDPEKRIQTAQALLHQVDEVETTLRDYSEAKTAQLARSADTFEIRDPAESKAPQESSRSDQTLAPGSHNETIEIATEEKSVDSSKPDYFNQVTEQQRELQSGSQSTVDPEKPKGVWTIAIALLAVLAVTGYGLVRAFSPPSADELFSKLEANRSTPENVRTEIELFQTHFSDDPRIETVNEMRGVADAIALHNKLSIRQNVAGTKNRLSELERQYLTIVDLVDDNPAAAYSKMRAFHTLHSLEKELSENDLQCVTAAGNYMHKIKRDAATKIESNREWIESALARAKDADKATAQEIHSSIIELYGSIEWATDLVAKSRAELEKDKG